MRTRTIIFSLLFLTSVFLPGVVALAATMAVLDSSFHIVPSANDLDPACPADAPLSFGAVMEIVQRLVNAGISFGILIFVIMMAWGGFLFITSAVNPESRNTARKMLGNAALGLLIILSAWLMVDFVMKTLYNPNASAGGTKFGPWNSILGDGPACVLSSTTLPLFSGSITATPGIRTTPPDESGEGSGVNCPVPAESTMVSFPSEMVAGGSGKATRETVNNFMAMREAAKKDGIDLKVSSAYRSDAAQVTLWNSLGKDTSKVAKPCSLGGGGSNHNSGTAIDIRVGCGNPSYNCNTATYRWLKENGSKWNFRNALPTDPPHWSPSGR